jgi:hypothetical protein
MRLIIVILFTLVAISVHDVPAGARPAPTPGGYTDGGDLTIPATVGVTNILNIHHHNAGLSGHFVLGNGPRPTIATVRTVGASPCRTSGIIPPLGAGHFGEPGIGGLALCPVAPGQPAPAAPPPTPFEGAYYAWLYIIDLPSPTASTQPEVAITGLDTFLTIKGEQHIVRDVPALGYDIHFDITSVYDVDWGDPRPDGSSSGAAITKDHHGQGGPYPYGDLRHQYIDRGSATITITQRWSATWSGGGDGGSLPDSVETTGNLTLPIQEIQALVTG